jgi:hypothetical protein
MKVHEKNYNTKNNHHEREETMKPGDGGRGGSTETRSGNRPS